MESTKVTIGVILTLLVVPVFSQWANATSSQQTNQPSLTAPIETRWLGVRRPERIDKMQLHPRPEAVLEFREMSFNPKWDPVAVGLPIGIFVIYSNTGPAESITSEFRIYFSRDGKLLEKRNVRSTRGLRGGRSSSTTFQIILPNNPGRYCWEVSFRQTDDGRMTLGKPKKLCALLKTKPKLGPMQRRP